MADTRLLAAAVFGGLLALGMIGGGALIGQGVVHARVGDRSVSVRGVAERDVKADLAILPVRFTASGEVLSEVQARIDGDLAIVRRFLSDQGYPAGAVALGRLEVADRRAREYGSQEEGPRFILAQTVIVRTADVDRVQNTTRSLNDLIRRGGAEQFARIAPTAAPESWANCSAPLRAEAVASAIIWGRTSFSRVKM